MKSIYSKLIGIFLLLAIPLIGYSHQKSECWVILADKDGMELDPYMYFDQKAISRRQNNNIPLIQFTDLPVRPDYIEQISSRSDSLLFVSRWMNAVVVEVNYDQLSEIAALPFVIEIWLEGNDSAGEISAYANHAIENTWNPNPIQLKLMKSQTERMKAFDFRDAGIDGRSVRIAIFDIGFKSYKTNPGFKHILEKNRIIKTWDFARKKENVDGHHSHGCMVMSCVGGFEPENDIPIGLATGAEYLLAITERRTEYFKEEVNWLAAAEWADKNGADIINSSLGYTHHRYFRYNMDGRTSFVARAAKIASDKGILVVNSAGNEGGGKWKNVGTPADVEEVLSVGGISPYTGIHACFSSLGPTWDRRMKPNVSAYGNVVASGPHGYQETSGTSFSSPLVTGFIACVMQMHPDWDRQKLFNEIQRSADLYPYFDYAHGYGVPQATYFTNDSVNNYFSEYAAVVDKGAYLQIVIDSSEFKTDTGQIGYVPLALDDLHHLKEPGHVYYHIENSKGYLDKYSVISLEDCRMCSCQWHLLGQVGYSDFVIYKSHFAKPFTLRVWYKNQLIEYQCNE